MQTQKMKTQHRDEWPEDMKLHSELWTEIFLKLPVKTLLRLRGVCKSWRSIIDSPAFITEHCQHFNENSHKNRLLLIEKTGYLGRSDKVIRVVNFRLEEIAQITTVGKDCRVWETLNGLFLFQDNGDTDTHTLNPILRICNPHVNKSFTLPPCPLSDLPVAKFVLGFDPSTEDYKVIGFRTKDVISFMELSSEIMVYSRNNNCWKTKTVQMNDAISYSDIQLRPPHFCQGAAHWMVRDVARKDGLFENTHVLSFDLRTEEFRCVELPERRTSKFLFIIRKSLAVFCISEAKIKIWVMREDDGERVPEDRWELYDTKNPSFDEYIFFKIKIYFTVLSRVTYDEHSGKIFAVTSNFPETKLMSYDITSQKIETCGMTVNKHTCYADTYVESLVSP